MRLSLGVVLTAISGLAAVQAAPSLAPRQSISTLTPAQVAAYKPYSFYAATAYCQPANTLAWNCGGNCNSNPSFHPVASGGNGDTTQFWYVGYDSTLRSVIVAYQGTDTSKIMPIVTDGNFFLESLDSSLFPGVSSSVQVHNGFKDAQAKSATAVLSAVQTAMSRNGATSVTIVGHSLGGAIALLSSVYLPLHLPAGTTFKTVTYGMPRVGNQAFADYVDAHASVSHINNKRDIVPIVPGRFLGFHHPKGEKHIVDSGAWIDCPGQDNTDAQCTIGYVPNVFDGASGDHAGPYDGVHMGC
ncbi:putative alpha beta-hydrolase [Lyophyllum shimeji]|uniref:Alpha beta-hydrolase n=1 Tax=Lyophyllum shimeji TaxID=47721 RepID=A0A9P3UQE0_LYOSH|nr:putative alpha beta-hydrolase [Lyophyllum shimeji]